MGIEGSEPKSHKYLCVRKQRVVFVRICMRVLNGLLRGLEMRTFCLVWASCDQNQTKVVLRPEKTKLFVRRSA